MTLPENVLVRIGPAGWSYDDWKGVVYPPEVPRRVHPLAFLCQLFDVVEVNATFYRPMTARQSAAWLSHITGNPDFAFTAKLWERYTHARESWPLETERIRYLDGLKPLADAGKLAALLVQFPWSFRRTPENRQWLARVLDAFAEWPLAVELRHASWDTEQLLAGLAARHVAFCNIDQPIFQDSIGPSEHVTAPFGYIRFHGRNRKDWFRDDAHRNDRYNYLYSENELEPWLERMRRMRNRVKELLVITNNHYRGQAVVNALEIQATLGKTQVVLPQPLVTHYPQLLRIHPDTV